MRLSGWRTSTAVPLPIHSRASAPRAIYTPSQHSWRSVALSGPLRVCGRHLEYASTAGSYYSGVQRLSSIRPFSTARRNSSQNGRHRTAPHRTASRCTVRMQCSTQQRAEDNMRRSSIVVCRCRFRSCGLYAAGCTLHAASCLMCCCMVMVHSNALQVELARLRETRDVPAESGPCHCGWHP